MHWTAEPIFTGRCVVAVAGGASLSLSQVREIGIARARNLIRVISINDAVYPCWFADLAYACDATWWKYHQGLPGFDGRRLSLDYSSVDGVDYLHNTGPTGFEPDPTGLRTGGNGGYQVLNLCAHLGAAQVLLVGYDMHGSHWFGDHPDGVRRVAPNMPNRIRHFTDLVDPLTERGVEVINCSPGSALQGVFPMGNLSTELKRLESVPKKPKPEDKQPVYVNRQMAAGIGGYRTR